MGNKYLTLRVLHCLRRIIEHRSPNTSTFQGLLSPPAVIFHAAPSVAGGAPTSASVHGKWTEVQTALRRFPSLLLNRDNKVQVSRERRLPPRLPRIKFKRLLLIADENAPSNPCWLELQRSEKSGSGIERMGPRLRA